MTTNLDDVAKKIAEAIAPLGLAPTERKELIAKIAAVSAGGELTTVGNKSEVDALQAASDALNGAKRWPTPVQAAAANPRITPELKLLKKNCARVGYDLQFDRVFSLADFDKAAAGHDPLLRSTCKRQANLLGLCE
jgi:hypothetical protein